MSSLCETQGLGLKQLRNLTFNLPCLCQAPRGPILNLEDIHTPEEELISSDPSLPLQLDIAQRFLQNPSKRRARVLEIAC